MLAEDIISGKDFNRDNNERLVALSNCNNIFSGIILEQDENGCVYYECENDDKYLMYFSTLDYVKSSISDMCSFNGIHELALKMWDVEIPDDSSITRESGCYKCDKIILKNGKSMLNDDVMCLEMAKLYPLLLFILNDKDEKFYLEVVKFDGMALAFVKDQTEEICIAAVEEDCKSFQFVKNQTEKVCLKALEKDGENINIIKSPTEEMCIISVKQDEDNLKYIKNQTPKICLTAVKNYGGALEHVKEQTPEICLAAVENYGCALEYVKEHNS